MKNKTIQDIQKINSSSTKTCISKSVKSDPSKCLKLGPQGPSMDHFGTYEHTSLLKKQNSSFFLQIIILYGMRSTHKFIKRDCPKCLEVIPHQSSLIEQSLFIIKFFMSFRRDQMKSLIIKVFMFF